MNASFGVFEIYIFRGGLKMKKPYVTFELVVLQVVANDIVRTSLDFADTTVMGVDNASYWDEAW